MSDGWHSTLCPFHDDTSPSASYSETGGFRCFACGTKGNLYRLLREELQLDDVGATQRYQEITGEVYEAVQSSVPGFPGGRVYPTKRDYERGSELFPSWFRRA